MTSMRVGESLALSLDETLARQRTQVLEVVPVERCAERLPLSNSIAWNLFHTARHAELALGVLTADGTTTAVELPDARLVQPDVPPGGGLQEVEQPWFDASVGAELVGYNAAVFAAARRYLLEVDELELDRVPSAGDALEASLGDAPELDWLREQWTGRPVSFFVLWPLTAHLVHHVGEAITYRNQMGLSPFR